MNNKMNMKRIYSLAFSVLFSTYFAIGQSFTNDAYRKATWMSLRFFGGQRSSTSDGSGPNWLIMDHAVSPLTINIIVKGF